MSQLINPEGYGLDWIQTAPQSRRSVDPLKRALDLGIAVVILIVCLPLLIVLATAIVIQDGGPPLFGHERLGLRGEPFRCWKLRTMATNAEELLAELLVRDEAARQEWMRDHKLRRDPRITPLGRLLRASSLDELPQLLNVLCGEMSMVGPRPIVRAEAARYGARYTHYVTVLPGMTGLWQVSGRNNVSYRRRVALDTIYCRRRSLGLDLWIMIMTVPAVVASRGAS